MTPLKKAGRGRPDDKGKPTYWRVYHAFMRGKERAGKFFAMVLLRGVLQSSGFRASPVLRREHAGVRHVVQIRCPYHTQDKFGKRKRGEHRPPAKDHRDTRAAG